MALDIYQAKRDFTRTSEPKGTPSRKTAVATGGVFVVHKHAARRLHYDFRLEHDGVLWSWAVTRGPSLDPDDKRLAVHVEDHPLEYGSFEGTIPAGQYGAGSVIIWDEGEWLPEGDPAFGMQKGHIAFSLKGHKLQGKWHLVRLPQRRGETRDNWLLIKVDDASARVGEDILETAPDSVKSGLSVEAVGRGEAPEGRVWAKTKRPRTGQLSPLGETVLPARPAKAARKRPDRAAVDPPPRFVEPCLATLQERPPAGEAWLHEVKFDGYRLQARLDGGEVTLLTRTGLDWTSRFGQALVAAFAALPCEAALIDGEAVVLGPEGIASFSALQDALSGDGTGAITFYAFDLLHLDGEDLRAEPLLARKERLDALLRAEPPDAPLRYSEHFTAPGQTMLRHACRMGLEGVISKRADAPYRSGRGRDWIKSKCTQRQEFVIVGYVPSKGSGRELGSIVAGYYEDGVLKPAGRVGTGFTRRSAERLKGKLDAITTKASSFAGVAARERGIVWVEPVLVAEIEFRAWTASKTLRHASFIGLREDKPAEEVVPEHLVAADPPAEAEPEPQAKPEPAKPKQKPSPKVPARATTAIRLSSPDKPLWPETLTKQGLLDYYATVWPLMQPYVVERPLSLVRAPNGITGHSFFQKHAAPGMHKAIATRTDKDGEALLYIRDFDGLAALVQLGTVEIHVWGAPIDAVETPDQVIFDLDPDTGLALDKVRDAAALIHGKLDELGFESFLKTSGGKGFHVVMPLKPKADWDQIKNFARDFAKALEQAQPKLYTATLSKQARRGRIFIDYLRNGRGATAIAPYSTRARPGAAVAMPAAWQDLATLVPDAFTAPAIRDGSMAAQGWSGFFTPRRALTGSR